MNLSYFTLQSPPQPPPKIARFLREHHFDPSNPYIKIKKFLMEFKSNYAGGQ